MNNTRSKLKRQQNLQINPEFIANPKAFLKKKAQYQYYDSLIKALLILYQKYNGRIFPSYNLLKKMTGAGETTLRLLINDMIAEGIIKSKQQQGRNKSNRYILHDIFKEHSFMRILKEYFGWVMLLTSLFAFPDSYKNDHRLLIYNDKIIECDVVTNVTKKEKTKRSLNEYRERWGEVHHEMSHYGGERPPSKPFTSTWEDMLPAIDYVRKQNEKEKRMEFTAEELSQLSQFSKQTVDYARDIVRKDEQQGKQISNYFKYFFAICERHKQRTATTGKRYAPEQSTPPPSSVAWKASTLAQDQYDRKVRIYNRQVKLYNAGYEYRNLSFGELYAMCVGNIPRTCLPLGTPPPDEPIYKEGLPVFWEEQCMTKPHDLEKTAVFPVYGTKQRNQPPESQLPPQTIDSFDEQYTPLVDAMYEGYEECLD